MVWDYLTIKYMVILKDGMSVSGMGKTADYTISMIFLCIIINIRIIWNQSEKQLQGKGFAPISSARDMQRKIIGGCLQEYEGWCWVCKRKFGYYIGTKYVILFKTIIFTKNRK